MSHPTGPAAPVAPAARRDAVASSINLARVAPDRRLQVVGPFAAQVGNRGMARLALARSPVASPTGSLPAVDQAAAGMLAKLGLSDANIAAFRAGQMVLFNLVVPGNDDTAVLLELKPGLVRGGILSIKVPGDRKLAIKAFAAARDRVLAVARAVHVSEYDLIGAAVHDKGIEEMLVRQKFDRTTEVLPEYIGLGPNAECEIFTKRFPVLPSAGDIPATDAPARADQAPLEPEEPEPANRRRPRGDGSGPRGRRPAEVRGLSGRGTTAPRGQDLRAGKATVIEPPRSSPVAPAPPAEANPRQRVAVPSGAGTTARELAAELSDKVTFTRRMTTMTQLVHWGLEAWKIYDLVLLVAQAQNLAAATFAHGSPYWQATEEARRVADRAADVQRQYNALDLRNSMPSHETAPADWDSEYTLFQIQSDFLWIENDLVNARSSLEGSIEELDGRRKQLKKGMEERERALLLTPTSLPYADAYLFASTGRQVNDRIDEAIASYQDADKAIEVQQLFARAAVKTLEMRLRALASSGRFGDIPDAELRGAPLSKFTMSR
jgi:hypothetical protein